VPKLFARLANNRSSGQSFDFDQFSATESGAFPLEFRKSAPVMIAAPMSAMFGAMSAFQGEADAANL